MLVSSKHVLDVSHLVHTLVGLMHDRGHHVHMHQPVEIGFLAMCHVADGPGNLNNQLLVLTAQQLQHSLRPIFHSKNFLDLQ